MRTIREHQALKKHGNQFFKSEWISVSIKYILSYRILRNSSDTFTVTGKNPFKMSTLRYGPRWTNVRWTLSALRQWDFCLYVSGSTCKCKPTPRGIIPVWTVTIFAAIRPFWDHCFTFISISGNRIRRCLDYSDIVWLGCNTALSAFCSALYKSGRYSSGKWNCPSPPSLCLPVQAETVSSCLLLLQR